MLNDLGDVAQLLVLAGGQVRDELALRVAVDGSVERREAKGPIALVVTVPAVAGESGGRSGGAEREHRRETRSAAPARLGPGGSEFVRSSRAFRNTCRPRPKGWAGLFIRGMY